MKNLSVLICFVLCVFSFGSCKKDAVATKVTLSTTTPNKVTNYSVASGGNIVSSDGEIIKRGVCYGINSQPTISGAHTVDGSGIGVFTSTLTGLSESTKYYFRAYASSSNTTVYGNEFTLITPASVTDVDGNKYKVIVLGKQIWMQENLKTSKFRNGNIIPALSDAAWTATTFAACGDYDNDPIKSTIYGKLYNWYTVADSRGLCPGGWHVPSDMEWNTVVKFIEPLADTVAVLSQSSIAGGEMKEGGIAHWSSLSPGANNNSGFTGLPGGVKDETSGKAIDLGIECNWWSTTQYSTTCYYSREIFVSQDDFYRNAVHPRSGYSIRCVKD